tara:strand:+ start:573 stop:1280 length:708 start_codon:yes stop_codon:yes gene_type:complete
MGFKLPGKSIQTGTSGHSSALKMVTEQRAASALKMQASPMKADEETFSQAYRKNRNAGENTFTYKGKSYTTESRSEKEARGGKGEYKNKRAKVTPEVKDDPLTKEIKDISDVKKAEGPREGTKKEKVAVVKDNLKDTKKQNKINTLKGKKDVADAKGKSKKSQRLADKIERKESRQDGDKSTNVSRRDQRKARKAKKEESSPRAIIERDLQNQKMKFSKMSASIIAAADDSKNKK